MTDPVVSVCITAYNHEPYIGQAIQSVLDQHTDFQIELIIGEDESRDATREIVASFASQHPSLIQPIYNRRSQNIIIDGHETGRRNLLNCLAAAKGKYIALLDGDDFWTDSEKLSLQVRLLEQSNQLSFCFHRVSWVDENNLVNHSKDYGGTPWTSETEFGIQDLIERGNFIPTCSVVFRNPFYETYPTLFYELSWGDYMLHLHNSLKGGFRKIDRIMGSYRAHADGRFGNLSKVQALEGYIKFMKKLEVAPAFRAHRREVRLSIQSKLEDLRKTHMENKSHLGALTSTVQLSIRRLRNHLEL